MILHVMFTLALLGEPGAPSEAPDLEALTETITARDAELFDVMFNRCEPEALADLVSDDMEFYHDLGGAMIGREAFVADYARSCTARLAPDAWRSRRVLTPGTLKVYPVPGYGAYAEGAHTFNERRGDGPETPVGRARFSILWKHDNGQWRVARVFSIDHAPIAAAPAP